MTLNVIELNVFQSINDVHNRYNSKYEEQINSIVRVLREAVSNISLNIEIEYLDHNAIKWWYKNEESTKRILLNVIHDVGENITKILEPKIGISGNLSYTTIGNKHYFELHDHNSNIKELCNMIRKSETLKRNFDSMYKIVDDVE